jgi:translocation and assembly module TamB
LAVALLFLALPALAQDTAEAERSWFVSYVEGQLSAPNRQIRINGIQGVLSSNATIGEITIADREGIWLRITNARIVWTRSALFVGRLDIGTLAADRIDVMRSPVPEEGMPPPEAGSLQIPELPLAVNIGALEVPLVTFGEGVFGLASQVSVGGHLQLVGGSLDTALDVTRLDGPGGRLALSANYANETQVLGLDFSLDEPADGIVANVLGIEGRPPMALALRGQGPLAELDLALTLDAGSQRVLTGTTRLRQQAAGLAFAATLNGPMAVLIPPRFRDFFGAETKLVANGLFKEAGGLLLEKLDVRSGALSVASTAETTTDGFLGKLKLDATIASGTAEKVVLPLPGGTTTVDRAALTIAFGQGSDEKWSGSLTVDQLSTDTFASKRVALTMGGVAENIALPAQRRVSFELTGAATGITAVRADVAKALGEQINLDIAGDWRTGAPIRLAKAGLSGNDLSVLLAGEVADFAFNGGIKVKAASIAPFSELAGRQLSGALDMDAAGSIEPVNGAFDLSIDSVVTGLGIGSEPVDNLLAGDTRITGSLGRGETGIVARQLRVFNNQTSAEANGTFASGAADFNFDFELNDLALVSDRAAGKLTAKGRAKGSDGLIGLTFSANVASGSLVDKPLADAVLGFEGTLQNGEVDGQIDGQALLAGVPIRLSSAIALLEKERRLGALNFEAGKAKISGDLVQSIPTGVYQGQLKVAAPDVSTAAALVLMRASGSLDADVVLKAEGSRQDATISANVRSLVVDTTRIGQAQIEANVADLLKVPMIDGTAHVSDAVIAGIEIARLNATATQKESATNFSADAQLKNGASAAVSGALSPLDGGYRVRLDTADLKQGALAARLTAPSTIQVQGQDIALDNLLLDVGGGRIGVRGTVAEKLSLAVSISKLPLAIANAIRPDLALGGTIDGSASVTGTRTAPEIGFDLKGRAIAAAALHQAGLSTIGVDAKGSSNAQRLTVSATVTSPEGLRATAAGAVPLDGGALALDVGLRAFPLAVLNAVVPGQGLGGTISGSAKIAGSLARPSANFNISGERLSATALDDFGLSPLRAAAAGSFSDRVITLSSADASAPAGLTLSASGRVDLAGADTSIAINGRAPLALANRFLADRGTQLSGTVAIAATVSGSLKNPAVRGTVSTSGAQVVDPEANLRLGNVALDAAIDGNTVTIRRASAAVGGGGSISATGTVSLAGGLPADIRISLDNARYADGNLVVATLSGRLAMTGPLLRDPLLSGDITVDRAEITVPETLGGGAAALDVKHIDASKAVQETLRRAKANDGTPVPRSRPSVVRLDINVSAPNRMFVRGRGLDAELGGSVRLTGSVTGIQPVGGFRLIRGRLSILGQRITFDEGTVSLVGDLDPFLDFVARSSGSDIVVIITVRGRVSDLDITFSSQPELPQDEVLARLIFNRGINELSAFQIAQLAAAAAELAGGSNNSLLGSLRAATGLDDLDVVTDSEGNAAVRAGRYIQDNVYLGIEAGEKGSTRGTINLDITDDLKARGSVGANGDSGLGIFYEKDY